MSETREQYRNRSSSSGGAAAIGILILLAWVIAGLVALVLSIMCFGKSGTTGQKVTGLLLALFFGPFYFIYSSLSTGYCDALTDEPSSAQPAPMQQTRPQPIPPVQQTRAQPAPMQQTRPQPTPPVQQTRPQPARVQQTRPQPTPPVQQTRPRPPQQPQ